MQYQKIEPKSRKHHFACDCIFRPGESATKGTTAEMPSWFAFRERIKRRDLEISIGGRNVDGRSEGETILVKNKENYQGC